MWFYKFGDSFKLQDMRSCMDLDGAMAPTVLDDNEDLIQFYMLNYTPLIFINNHLYKGNFEDTLHLVESLCMTFETPPKECSKLEIFTEYEDYSSTSLWSFIVYTVAYLGVFFLILVTCFYIYYKRKMKRKMDSELESRINSAIMKYYGKSQVTEGVKGVGNDDLKGGLTEDERKISEENSG